MRSYTGIIDLKIALIADKKNVSPVLIIAQRRSHNIYMHAMYHHEIIVLIAYFFFALFIQQSHITYFIIRLFGADNMSTIVSTILPQNRKISLFALSTDTVKDVLINYNVKPNSISPMAACVVVHSTPSTQMKPLSPFVLSLEQLLAHSWPQNFPGMRCSACSVDVWTQS